MSDHQLSDQPDLVGEGLSPGQSALLARARNFSRYKQMRADLIKGKCTFCEIDPEVNKVVVENDHWVAWEVPRNFAEKNTALHALIVPRKHAAQLYELPDEALAEGFNDIRKKVEAHFKIFEYGLLLRNGPLKLAGTVEHLHWHVMTPSGEGRLETPLAKSAAEEREGELRAILYERMLQGENLESFTPDEQARLTPDRLK